MSAQPIQSGDDAIVVGGLARHKSPNLGLRVRVASLQGEHSQHGRIWRCTGAGVKQLQDNGEYVVTGEADFATDWLQKIPPTPTDKVQDTVNEGLTA